MSDVMDIAAGSASKSSSGPTVYESLVPAVYDADSGRTYQLVKRASDRVPHMLSCAGEHKLTALDALNKRRRLTWERNELKRPHKERAERFQLPDAKAAERAETLGAEIKALPSVEAERCDRVTRGLKVLAAAQPAQPAQ